MTSPKAVLLSLPVVAVALGALAVGLVELGRYLGLGLASLFLLAVPFVLALVYSLWYRTLPYEPRGGPTGMGAFAGTMGPTDEPFEDPVEEADRLGRAGPSDVPEESPAVVEDDTVVEPTPTPEPPR